MAGTPAGSRTGSHPHRGLPGAQRIKKRPDFLRIQDSPTRVNTRHLLVLLSSRRDVGHDGGSPGPLPRPPRLGVVASRKVGNAVARNRAKRLVREAFRLNQDRLPRELDLVIIVRPGTHELGLADVAGEIVQAAPQIARRARELSRGG